MCLSSEFACQAHDSCNRPRCFVEQRSEPAARFLPLAVQLTRYARGIEKPFFGWGTAGCWGSPALGRIRFSRLQLLVGKIGPEFGVQERLAELRLLEPGRMPIRTGFPLRLGEDRHPGKTPAHFPPKSGIFAPETQQSRQMVESEAQGNDIDEDDRPGAFHDLLGREPAGTEVAPQARRVIWVLLMQLLRRRMTHQRELEELDAIVPGGARQCAAEEIVNVFQRASDKDKVRIAAGAQHAGGQSQQAILLVIGHRRRSAAPETGQQVRTAHVPTKGFSTSAQFGILRSGNDTGTRPRRPSKRRPAVGEGGGVRDPRRARAPFRFRSA